MAPKEKDIFKVDWINTTTRKGDLINKLNDLHSSLTKLSQETSNLPKTLKSIASNIASSKIMGHNDRDVRLLGACCMVDIFRVYAPEAPLTDDEMIKAFEVIVNLLRGLSTHDLTSAVGSKLQYILSSLATIKSCVVPVILASNGVEGAYEVTKNLFDVLISSIRADHNEEALGNINEILTACIEESDDIDPDILEYLLLALLPSAKNDNPTAFKSITHVLRRTVNYIQNSLSQYVNNILVNIAANSNEKISDISEQIYTIIYELHRISPGLLNKIIPNICLQLQVEDEPIRLKAVKLLGILFASQSADYGEEFIRNFNDFLGRFRDLSDNIRSEMLENAAVIMKNKPNLRCLLEEPIALRLRDSEQEVRAKALKCLLDIALENPLSLAEHTFEELGHRVVDKKLEIRKFALIGLAKVYYRNVSLNVMPFNESIGSIESIVNSDIWIRMKAIPGLIIKSWGYPDIEYRHQVVQLLQEYMLPKTFKDVDGSQDNDNDKLDEYRATALLLLYSSCEDTDKRMLSAILSFKSKVRNDFVQLLDYHNNTSNTASRNDELDLKSNKRIMNRIVQLVPFDDKKTNLLEKLLTIKDKTVFRLIGNINDQNSSYYKLIHSRDDIKQRLDSKSHLSEYVEYLYNFSSYLIINEKIIKSYINYLIAYNMKLKSSNSCTRENISDIIERLLIMFAGHSTKVFKNIFDCVFEWLDSIIADSLENMEPVLNNTENEQLSNCCEVIDYACQCVYLKDSTSDSPNLNEICSICSNLFEMSKLLISDSNLSNKLAQTAARLYVALFTNTSIQLPDKFTDSNNIIKSLLNEFVKSDNFKGIVANAHQFHNQLLVIAAIVTVPIPNSTTNKIVRLSPMICSYTKKEYKQIRDKLISYLKDRILSERLNDELSINNKKMKSSYRNKMIECIGTCINIITNILLSEAEILLIDENIEKYTNTIKGLNTITELDDLMTELFQCIDCDGSQLYQLQFNTHSNDIKSSIKYYASSNLFYLLKVEWIAKRFSITHWHKLAWTLLDPDVTVRQNLFNILCNQIQTKLSLLQFISYTCLLANDDTLKSKAESSLSFAIKRLRKTHEELCIQALLDNNDELRQQAEETMPEVILPYVMHLLSYHPEFPSSATFDDEIDKKRMNHVIKSLKMILRVLLESVESDTDNISYLLKQVTLILQQYEDKNDPDNIGLQFVARITMKLLNESIKTAENVQVYPGDIYLPVGLFKYKETNSDDVTATQMDEFLEADQAITHALNKLGKGVGKSTVTNSPGVKNVIKKSKLLELTDKSKSNKKTSPSIKSKAISKTKSVKQKIIQDKKPVDTVTRRSNRSKSASVDYIEPDENEDEVIEWENLAAESKKKIKQIKREPLKEIHLNRNIKGGSNIDFSENNLDNTSEKISNKRAINKQLGGKNKKIKQQTLDKFIVDSI